jgi:MFS family permease
MKALLAKIYLYRIFSELILLYPLYNVMFADAGHLSTFQISSLLMIWSVIILVAEIPSGALADRYSRRNLLVTAQVIRAIGYALWIIMPNYIGFLAGLALWGIGRAFTSGAFEALVYDELKSNRLEKNYAKVIGRSESLSGLFSLGSTLAATPVFLWLGYKGIVWGSVISVVIASLIALTLPHSRRQKAVETPHYRELIRQAILEIKRSPYLLKLVIFAVFIGMLFRIFDEYASLIIHAASVPVGWVPIASALVFTPVILIGFIAHRFENLSRAAYLSGLAAAGALLIIGGFLVNIPGLVFFSLFMLLVKLTEIIFGAKIQHSITGSARATITSINSFGVEVSAVGGFFIYGLMVQLGGTGLALQFFGAASLLAALGYFLISRRRITR